MKKEMISTEAVLSLTARESVRLRPAMYIGSVGAFGLHAMLFDVVGFLANDFFEGHGAGLSVKFEKDGSVSLESDWCEIPLSVNTNDSKGRTYLELEATEIFVPGNLDFPPANSGIAPTNFLSEFFEIEAQRDGEIHFLRFEQGLRQSSARNLGSSLDSRKTRIRFKPDSKVFAETRFDFDRTLGRLRELACFLPGFTFIAEDSRHENARREILNFSGGVADYVSWLSTEEETLLPKPFFTRINDLETTFEAAFQFVAGETSEKIFSMANGYVTEQGGAHVSAFLAGFLTNRSLRKGFGVINVKPDVLRRGLVAAISLRVPTRELRFEGRTRAKMAGRLSENITTQLNDAIELYFDEHPGAAKRLRAHFLS